MFDAAKRPRQYAAEILQLETIEQRRAALAAVPEYWRDYTEHLVRDEYEKRAYARRAKANKPKVR